METESKLYHFKISWAAAIYTFRGYVNSYTIALPSMTQSAVVYGSCLAFLCVKVYVWLNIQEDIMMTEKKEIREQTHPAITINQRVDTGLPFLLSCSKIVILSEFKSTEFFIFLKLFSRTTSLAPRDVIFLRKCQCLLGSSGEEKRSVEAGKTVFAVLLSSPLAAQAF